MLLSCIVKTTVPHGRYDELRNKYPIHAPAQAANTPAAPPRKRMALQRERLLSRRYSTDFSDSTMFTANSLRRIENSTMPVNTIVRANEST